MYTRKNAYASSPGVWFTDDGEYELYRESGMWHVRHRAHWNGRAHVSRLIGTEPTLNAGLVLAGRHHVHPVVPVDTWEYPRNASDRPVVWP